MNHQAIIEGFRYITDSSGKTVDTLGELKYGFYAHGLWHTYEAADYIKGLANILCLHNAINSICKTCYLKIGD